jgi:hypothetical protein
VTAELAPQRAQSRPGASGSPDPVSLDGQALTGRLSATDGAVQSAWDETSLSRLQGRLARRLPRSRASKTAWLDPAIRRATGLTPRQRAALMAAAKAVAIPLATAVRSRQAHAVQRLGGGLSRDEWAALAVIALAAADPARLLAIVSEDDDGIPEGAEKQHRQEGRAA